MVKLNPFQYYRPASLQEAISLKEKFAPTARFIAGGSDVLVEIKVEKSKPEYLISLNNIPELNYIIKDSNGLRIGALTTHRKLEMSVVIKEEYQVLHDAVRQIGSVQIRNVATLGGNLCSALPSADSASPLLVLDAQVKTIGKNSERIIPLKDFFISPGKSILDDTEILTEILIPSVAKLSAGAYIKLGRRKAMEPAIVGAAVHIEIDTEGICKKARVALTTVAPTPARSPNAEAALEGERIDAQVARHAGEKALQDVCPRTSARCTAEHRTMVIPVLIERACLTSIERINSIKH